MTTTAITSFITGLCVYHGNRSGAAHEARLKELSRMLHPEVRPDARPAAGLEMAAAWAELGPAPRHTYDGIVIPITNELTGVSKERLDLIRSAKSVHFTINSSGGDCRAAESILEALGTKPCSCHITGYAASASAMLAICITGKRTIASNGSMMLHSPSACASGDAKHHRQIADWLERDADKWTDHLVRRTGQPRAVCASWMAGGNRPFNAEQAVHFGLVDAVA